MAVDDHGLEVLKKAGEPHIIDQKVDYYHNVSEPYLRLVKITEVVNSQKTFIGYAHSIGDETSDLDSLKSKAVWKIVREITFGNETQRAFAEKDGVMNHGFVHVWDDREDLFPTPALDNPASLLFDGTDEFITLGDNYTFGPATAFSWSFWMKAQNFASQRCFVSKTSQDAAVQGYSFQHNSSGKLFAQMRASGTNRNATFSTTLNAGQWYHICFTYAGGSNINGLTAYIDGVAEPTPGSGSLNAWTVTDPLHIAKRGTSFEFSGNLNQISVWNKELSSSEVTELYNSGSPGDLSSHSAVANLLSWWLLNTDANFPTETDQIGSVNGTLTNMESGDYDSGDVP